MAGTTSKSMGTSCPEVGHFQRADDSVGFGNLRTVDSTNVAQIKL
jgi:hypothetical protein